MYTNQLLQVKDEQIKELRDLKDAQIRQLNEQLKELRELKDAQIQTLNDRLIEKAAEEGARRSDLAAANDRILGLLQRRHVRGAVEGSSRG